MDGSRKDLKEDKQHVLAWEAFAADLSRGDCTMTSLSERARVTLPTGQAVSKEEYKLACAASMDDGTVEGTYIAPGQLVTMEDSTFNVETSITTDAVARQDGTKRRISYPVAFFMTMDLTTNEVTEMRMYAQNIALLAARGYTMAPDDNFAPVIRPA